MIAYRADFSPFSPHERQAVQVPRTPTSLTPYASTVRKRRQAAVLVQGGKCIIATRRSDGRAAAALKRHLHAQAPPGA